MTGPPTFRLIPLDQLRTHEEIDAEKVRALAGEIRRRQVVDDPIWVARADEVFVILNGHHRVAALRLLGAVRAPAWVLDYASSSVRLERWTEGPPISKDEVVARAKSGRLFPPKTTRHVVEYELPGRSTSLGELEGPVPAARPPST